MINLDEYTPEQRQALREWYKSLEPRLAGRKYVPRSELTWKDYKAASAGLGIPAVVLWALTLFWPWRPGDNQLRRVRRACGAVQLIVNAVKRQPMKVFYAIATLIALYLLACMAAHTARSHVIIGRVSCELRAGGVDCDPKWWLP
jgi:hypothetical protein